MHTGPARRETPAAPALFLPLAAIETPFGNLIGGRKCCDPKGQGRIQEQRRHAKRHAPGPPKSDALSQSIRLPTFFTIIAPMCRQCWVTL